GYRHPMRNPTTAGRPFRPNQKTSIEINQLATGTPQRQPISRVWAGGRVTLLLTLTLSITLLLQREPTTVFSTLPRWSPLRNCRSKTCLPTSNQLMRKHCLTNWTGPSRHPEPSERRRSPISKESLSAIAQGDSCRLLASR